MNELNKLRRELKETGSRDEQSTILVKIILLTLNIYLTAMNKMRQVSNIFKDQLENWRLYQEVGKYNGVPTLLQDFAHKTVIYVIAFLAAITFESALGGIISQRNGWSFWNGFAFAVIITLLFDAGIASFALKNSASKPLESERKTTHWFFYPALGAFMVSLLVFAAGRIITGSTALMMAPYLTGGLFLMTISLMFVSAGCLVMAGIYNWSRRTTRMWQLERNQVTTASGIIFESLNTLHKNGYDINPIINEIKVKCEAENIPSPMFLVSLQSTTSNMEKSTEIKNADRQIPLLSQSTNSDMLFKEL